jgi:8-oxo-dGTP pyrophosphatase MutT (NUDIX family)
VLLLRFLAVALSLIGIRAVGIILVDREGRFLVNLRGRGSVQQDDFRHPARPYLQGRWAILAGAVERGEEPEATAARELREETGVEVGRLRLVVRSRWPRPVYLFAAGIPHGAESLHLGEGVEHRFVTAAEAGRLSPRIPLLKPVLAAFAGTDAYRACLEDARAADR